MGILDNVSNGLDTSFDTIAATIKNPFANTQPVRFGPDFAEGFIIQEYDDGVPGAILALTGNRMPKQPFTFGGEQKIVKEFYPGNSEPSTQVLGARESDTIIKGKLKAKQFTSPGSPTGLYKAPQAFQEELDEIRKRGKVCRFTLGEWQRYGYVSKAHFEMHTLSNIDYELTLDIVGFNPPVNGKFVDETKELPFAANKTLIAQVNAIVTPPTTFPKSFASVVNGLINDAATAISVVTDFVDTTLKTAEDVTGALNRALGLVKNARASIAIFNRRIGAIGFSLSNLGITNGNSTASATQIRAQLHASATNNTSYLLNLMASMRASSATLAAMQANFEALTVTTPEARYLIKTGDTLQRIAIKYLGDADQWKTIYDHNKLTSTLLVVGNILEIPKAPGTPTSIDPSQAKTTAAPGGGG